MYIGFICFHLTCGLVSLCFNIYIYIYIHTNAANKSQRSIFVNLKPLQSFPVDACDRICTHKHIHHLFDVYKK